MKKRFVSILCAAALMFGSAVGPLAESGVLPLTEITVNAENIESDFKYIILDDGTAAITEYVGTSDAVEFPSTIGGIEVTQLGDGNMYILDRSIFFNSIAIPNTVTTIADYAFLEDKIRSVYFEESSSLKRIGDDALNCFGLFQIVYDREEDILPDSLESIGEAGFCFGDFIDHTAVLTIPNSLKEIDEGAFLGLKCVRYDNTPPIKSDWHDEDSPLINNGAFVNAFPQAEYVYANSDVPPGFFAGMDSLRSVTLGSNVKNIGKCAFENCYNLSEVNIQGSLETIGSKAFAGCKSLYEINLPDSLQSIGESTFEASGLSHIEIPENVGIISPAAFEGCDRLEYAYLNEGIKKISEEAFMNCGNLREIYIPSTLSSIAGRSVGYTYEGDSVYTKNKNLLICCPSLSSDGVNYSMGRTYALNNTFSYYLTDTKEKVETDNSGSTTTTVIADDNDAPVVLDFIMSGSSEYDYYFDYKKLDDDTIEINAINHNYPPVLIIPSTYEGYKVKEVSLSDLDNVKAIIFSPGIERINYFNNCDNLQSVFIANGTKTIYGFMDCPKLKNVTIPESVTTIYGHSFRNTPWLEDRRAESPFVIVNNMLLDASTCKGKAVVPDNVTKICSRAFRFGNDLTEVIVPESVTYIGEGAFEECDNLISVTLPDSITELPEYLFDLCKSLKNVKLPAGIKEIKRETFLCCESLQNISIPDGVTYIGVGAFSKCKNLESIEIPEGVTFIGQDAFYCCEKIKQVKIPKNVTHLGYRAFSCCTALDDLTISKGVTEIGSSAFSYCTSLKSVDIPSTVTSIGDRAFTNCSSLESIVIPDSISSIEEYTFWECTSLSSVTIPDSVTKIGIGAFLACPSLKSVTIPKSVTSIGSKAFAYVGYYDDRMYNITIYGYRETAAETYAKNKYKITFVALDGEAKKAGDIDGDGKLNNSDLLLVKSHIKGIKKLTGDALKAADVNNDGKVNNTDLIAMKAHIKGVKKLW